MRFAPATHFINRELILGLIPHGGGVKTRSAFGTTVNVMGVVVLISPSRLTRLPGDLDERTDHGRFRAGAELRVRGHDTHS